MTSRIVAVLVVAGLAQLPVLAGADERKAAESWNSVAARYPLYSIMAELPRIRGIPLMKAGLRLGPHSMDSIRVAEG